MRKRLLMLKNVVHGITSALKRLRFRNCLAVEKMSGRTEIQRTGSGVAVSV
jgi:hypothetical protein